jgi:hypothetical protein
MSAHRLLATLPLLWLALSPAAVAQILQPLPGNLIASVNEFTGSSGAPRYLAEYTTTGIRRQRFPSVPQPGGTGPTTEFLRDVLHGPGNAVYVYNGTFNTTLTRLDLQTGSYTQQTIAGFSTVNNLTFGGLAQMGQYVFATDMQTFNAGGEPQGIIRFDTLGGAPIRFAETIQPSDLNMGADGFLYALNGAGSPNPQVFRYDPNTFALQAVVPILFEDNRAVAVTADGSIFIATGNGMIRRYSSTGALQLSLQVSNAFFGDIDISADGRIALGTAGSGEIVLTDTTLTSFTRFRATDSTSGGNVFVAWAQVPEPSTYALSVLGLASLIAVARRRR